MELKRREMLRMLAAAPVAAGFTWTETEAAAAAVAVRDAQAAAAQGGGSLTPQFFTAHEYETVGVLADLIIPRDERSGSASEAGVPQYIDFIMTDSPNRQTAMRGGLAWLDAESQRRFDRQFVAATDAQRRQILDDIAWPERAPAGVSHGVPFFTSFRDLVASGFWTSKMGIEDLRYMGNTFVRTWDGCPDEVLEKLGLA